MPPCAPLSLTRRRTTGMLMAILGSALAPGRLLAATDRLGPPRPFSWEGLVARARGLAREQYRAPSASPTAASDYDSLGRLTYGEAQAVAGNVRLFPASKSVAPHAVRINILEGGR